MDNKPCAASNNQGYVSGPILNGVQTENSIVVNDEIPGPEIRAKLGDTVRVTVVNYLGEPTTMHFHGITQFRTPFMDGDEMVSESDK
jgi:FtsP/CotA-like multicopper oxidase with cupredoxin domain